MLNTISWQGYWVCTALATIAYYLFLRYVYFRGSLFNGLHRSKKEPSTVTTSNSGVNRGTLSEDIISISRPSQNEEQLWDACMDEINAFFEAQKKSKAVKGEVVFALHQILQKYSALREPETYESISNAIKVQCENICSISLSDEELKGVWYG